MTNDNGATVKASFRILGDKFIPDEVTKRLSITPDKSHIIGDLRKGNPRYMPYDTNGWYLNSGILKSETLEKHLNSLLEQLLPQSEYLKEISGSNQVEFYCGVFITSGNWTYLSHETIQDMASIGSSLSLTNYVVGEDDDS